MDEWGCVFPPLAAAKSRLQWRSERAFRPAAASHDAGTIERGRKPGSCWGQDHSHQALSQADRSRSEGSQGRCGKVGKLSFVPSGDQKTIGEASFHIGLAVNLSFLL